MIKEPGVFSQRYLMRKGKENVNHANVHHQTFEHDFPLAYTSAKTISRQRSSISVSKKRVEEKRNDMKEIEEKGDLILKLQKELKQSRDQVKKLSRELQNKCSQYDNHIDELADQLKEKEKLLEKISTSMKQEMKSIKEQRSNVNKYKETIKKQIYWLLYMFKVLHEEAKIDEIKKEVSNAFLGFKDYITEFSIEKELQNLASSTLNHIPTNYTERSILSEQPSRKNMDSIFTQDLQELNMVKIMELQPLIETFNNQQYCAAPDEEENHKMQRITKRLFDDSQIMKESNNCSISMEEQKKHLVNNSQMSENQFLPKEPHFELPKEVRITKGFEPDSRHENYIALKQGQNLKLLRKIRDKLWIGEVGEKIGLVSQDYFGLS